MAGVNKSNGFVGDDRERVHDVSFVGCEINEYLTNLLGQEFQEYREKWIKAERHLQQAEFPLFLQVETVDACNLRCAMCFRRLQQGRKGRCMAPELFQQIIDQIQPGKCPSMCLNGNNEPLLDPHLAERIAMAHAAGVLDTRINTNGMLLTENRSRALIESGLTRLSVSIDAARPATYDKIRTGGDFAKVVANVRKFLEVRRWLGVRLPLLRVTFVVLNDNREEQDEFVRFWQDQADYVSFQSYVPHTQEDGDSEIGGEAVTATGEQRCSQPFERLVIDVEGNVFPCCAPLGSGLLIGSLKEHSLQHLWDSARMQELRQHLATNCLQNEPVCAICKK